MVFQVLKPKIEYLKTYNELFNQINRVEMRLKLFKNILLIRPKKNSVISSHKPEYN